MISQLVRNILVVASLLGLSGTAAAQSASGQWPDPLAAGWKGQSVCEKLHEDDAMRVLRCIFPPGVGHERRFHPTHYVYVLNGGKVRVTSTAGTQEIEVKTGAAWMNRPIEWHEVLNVSD